MDTGFTNLVHRGGDDDAHTDGQGANQNRQCDVLVVDDFLPEVIRSQLVDQHERNSKDYDSERRINYRVQESMSVQVHLPPMYRE
jgi:hypothetical protein